MASSSNFVRHEPCPSCGSKDNLSRYDDGHGWCEGCHTYQHAKEGSKVQTNVQQISSVNKNPELKGMTAAIKDRKISYETCKKYGVTVEGEGLRHHYPYYKGTTLVAVKTRICKDKQFYVSGDMRGVPLFGQHLFKNSGKYVTIVEGELDALAAYEMLGSHWPVVSIPKGAGGAKRCIQDNLEWLEGFENVVICFDNDEPGREAAEACAPILSPNKAKIVTLETFKDPSDFLLYGKGKEFSQNWWNAKVFVMTGIITLADAWGDFLDRGKEEIIPFPESFGYLNTMLNGGIAAGEITVIGALTSVGKTTMINEITYGFWKNTNKRIGGIFLEASNGEVIESFLTIHTSTNLSLEDKENINYESLYTDIITDSRILLVDHKGSADVDDIFVKFRSMIKGNNVEVLVIDPLQLIVQSNNNEMIDEFMDRLVKLAKETNVSIVLVSHMRKPPSTNPHAVSEYDLKGSGSINQIAFNTILLSRDKMNEDEYAKNSTLVQVVKCRRTGITGVAGWLHYDSLTGRLEAGQPPDVYATSNEEF